jgi:hypothetical protein
MGKSNAERQAAYRERHLKNADGTLERVNTLVSVQAKRRLERLAACYGVTQRGILERLLTDAERAALDGLPADQQAAYYDKRLPAPVTA